MTIDPRLKIPPPLSAAFRDTEDEPEMAKTPVLKIPPPAIAAAFAVTEVRPLNARVPALRIPPPFWVTAPFVITKLFSTTDPALTVRTRPTALPSSVGVG